MEMRVRHFDFTFTCKHISEAECVRRLEVVNCYRDHNVSGNIMIE
jgi:hypothetical protein